MTGAEAAKVRRAAWPRVQAFYERLVARPGGEYEFTRPILELVARLGQGPYAGDFLPGTSHWVLIITTKTKRGPLGPREPHLEIGGARVETPHLDIRYRPTDWGPAKGAIPPVRKE